LTSDLSLKEYGERKAKVPSALKIALEDLLRARRLQADAPPLRGEDRRLSPLPTGLAAVDRLLGSGLPRGQVSEIYGPASSGRTALALALLARVTSGGALGAWVDPGDRLDPASAAAAGTELGRLLWLRGEPRTPGREALSSAISALGTLLGSGLFEVLVLDVAGFSAPEVQRLPGSTWIRLQRMIEGSPGALVLLAADHTAHGPGGVSLGLRPAGPLWSGRPGPGRLLRGLGVEARIGRQAGRSVAFEIPAFP
jgi:recA bacterial DNA recombination protein